jgi:4-amino-4-deoxy-L-arabinose transferase-like glycosyltransferase
LKSLASHFSEWGSRFLAIRRQLVFGYVIVISLIRIPYALFVMDPHSGQDAPSYFQDTTLILKDGFFSPVVNAPTWPIGYTWFMGTIWKVFGVDSRALGVVQSILLTLAILSLYQLVKREINQDTALLASFLVTSSAALFVSAAEIMYEVPMTSFFLIGANYISLAYARAESRFQNMLAGSFFLSLAILIHPSAGAPVLALFALSVWRILRAKMISVFQFVLVFVVLTWGPLLNITYNAVAYDTVGYTTSAYGSAHDMAGWGKNDELSSQRCDDLRKQPEGPKNIIWDSAPPSVCLLLVTAKDPAYFAKVMNFNAHRWISPFIGVSKGNGTWYHGLDWRRLFPGYTWWEGGWKTFDLVLCYTWIVFHVTLAIRGIFILGRKWRQNQMSGISGGIFVAPVLMSFMLSLMTVGDTRHRMIISPLYIALISVALIEFIKFAHKSWLPGRLK